MTFEKLNWSYVIMFRQEDKKWQIAADNHQTNKEQR